MKDNIKRLQAIWLGLSRCESNTQYITSRDVKTFYTRSVNEGAEFYSRVMPALRQCLLSGLENGYLNTLPVRFKSKGNTLLPTFMFNAWAAIFEPSHSYYAKLTPDGERFINNDETFIPHQKESNHYYCSRSLISAMDCKWLAECYPYFADSDSYESELRECGYVDTEAFIKENSIIKIQFFPRTKRVEDISVDAVSCLNQLLAVFGKIEGGHTPESEVKCLLNFLDTEDQLTHFLSDWRQTKTTRSWFNGEVRATFGELLQRTRQLIAMVLVDADPRDIVPKHGSGVSACQTPLHKRYGTPRYVREIDNIWSYSDFYYLGAAQLSDELGGRDDKPGEAAKQLHLDHLVEYEPCAKVLLVPKDARGPRIISCEPRETMWIQQGLMRKLVTTLESHPLTRGLLNFTDQSINQEQAFIGSITGELATLDLKDASDRVSLALVKELLPSNWYNALAACRSKRTEMPDGTLVTLSKHAPMGSATCFPVMALCIWGLLTAFTNVLEGIPHRRSMVFNQKRWTRKHPVYVYGDDIIIPSVFVPEAIEVLESVGLKVNTNKSFAYGLYRESCGKEYFRGLDVTPVRLRAMPDDNNLSRMRLIAFHNNVYRKYGVQPGGLTALIHEWYERVPEKSTLLHDAGRQKRLFASNTVLGPLLDPQGFIDMNIAMSGVLNVYRADNSRLRSRWNPRFQRREYRFLDVIPKRIKYGCDNWSQVFRALVNPRSRIRFGQDAVANRVSYKYRWSTLH